MYAELLTKDELWKTLGAMLPIVTAILATIRSAFHFLKTGKINRLKNIYTDYGEHLSKDEKLYISKEIRKRLMRQLVGFNDSKARRYLVYILGRLDLKLPRWRMNSLLKFLNFNGVRFYFEINRHYKRRAFLARLTSVFYFGYIIFLGWVYYRDDWLGIGLIGTIILSIVCVFFSFFLMALYPTRKEMMSINGKLLTLDISDYLKDSTRR